MNIFRRALRFDFFFAQQPLFAPAYKLCAPRVRAHRTFSCTREVWDQKALLIMTDAEFSRLSLGLVLRHPRSIKALKIVSCNVFEIISKLHQ